MNHDPRFLAAVDARELVNSSWQRDAECLDVDSELFFPVGYTGLAIQQTNQAKAVCRRCFVSDICLASALQDGAAGIWGETSEEERRVMSREWHTDKGLIEAEKDTNSPAVKAPYNPRKLSWEKVDAIRADDSSSLEKLAAQYGVSRSAIKAVRSFTSWTGPRPKVDA